VVGYRPGHGDPSRVRESIAGLADAAAASMDLETRLAPEEIDNCGAHVGEAYGIPTPAGLEAVHLTARTEGILLDPVYTGKAMAGLIDLCRKGVFTKDQNVVFLHTGGFAALFAYEADLAGAW
jgi:L-cysteate sulfo-lyase